MNILNEIAEKTKVRVEQQKKKISMEEIRQKAFQKKAMSIPDFKKALQKKEISFICEVKKASPSKGIIAKEFPYLEIAKDYEAGGASAISVLTEPYYFQGSNDYLTQISKVVHIPILRKDFVVDVYQIYEAKCIGASAVLLICAILNDSQLKEYIEIIAELGMSALVEAHDEVEIQRALQAGAEIIGVNNRDLKTFMVDIQNGIRLRKEVPENIVFVSESGIRTHQDIVTLKRNHVNAVLIGETLMRAEDRTKALIQLRRGREESDSN